MIKKKILNAPSLTIHKIINYLFAFGALPLPVSALNSVQQQHMCNIPQNLRDILSNDTFFSFNLIYRGINFFAGLSEVTEH